MRELNFISAIGEALYQEMKRDQTVFVMGEDLWDWGGPWGDVRGLKEFGRERVRDTPISESAFVGAAIGSAITGMRPVVNLMFIDFAGVCMDQIWNHATKIRYMFGGKAKVPMVIKASIGAGIQSAAQHSQSSYAFFAHMSGIKVAIPSTPYDAKGLLITAIRDDDPVLFCEHKLLLTMKGSVPEESYAIPFGEAAIRRKGEDITVVATALMVHKTLNAAKTFEKKGISVEVIDPRTIVPLDKNTILDSVKKTGRLVIVDEGYDRCGVASWIAAIVADEAFDYLDAPIKRVSSPNVPIPFSPILEKAVIPDENKIIKSINEIIVS